VGVPWLAHTCGKCKFCKNGHENLCDNPLFTGYTVDGGFAEYTVAYEQYCFNLSNFYSNSSGAPLMCAGLIGYRSYKMLDKKVENIGIYGFGAAAHIIIQLAVFQKKKVYVFTRAGDKIGQKFAMDLGAEWAGDSEEMPPVKLDAAIIFAPLGDLIPKALQDVDKGSMVVCGGIHMTDIPSFPYHLLWEERSLHSVANLTREDGVEFLELAEKVPVRATTVLFKLQEANQAIDSLRQGKIHGAAVLVM
jgi:propanol-preferring alcohol dehydrogenase